MNQREIKGVGGEEKWTDDRSILDGWTDFLLSVRGLAAGTVARYRGLVERLLAEAAVPIAQVDRGAIERHLRRLHVAGRGESVRQGMVVAVRSLGEWCLSHGVVTANPGAALSGPRPYRREIKVLSVAEVGRLLWGSTPGALPPDPRAMRDRVLLGVAYVAGATPV
jgi:site-specific recombinase XerD